MKAIVRLASGSVAVLVCALSAHAAAYRSFWPSDGIHGYFGWYEPLVGILSGVSAATVAFSLLLGVRARGGTPSSRERALLGWLRPWRSPSPLGGAVLAVLSLAALVVQESVERSVSLHRLAPASFPATTWLVVVASVALGATILRLLARWCIELVEIIFRERTGARRIGEIEPGRPPTPPARRRPNPLASRLGMRAPPAASLTAI